MRHKDGSTDKHKDKHKEKRKEEKVNCRLWSFTNLSFTSCFLLIQPHLCRSISLQMSKSRRRRKMALAGMFF